MSLVDIHVPDGAVDDDLSSWGRPLLALALAERGLDVTFSCGVHAYELAAGRVSILQPTLIKVAGLYEVTTTPRTIELAAIDAVRNVAKPIGCGVPELNDPLVNSLLRDKLVSNTLLEGLNLAKSVAPVDLALGIEPALEAVPGRSAVLKPRRGMRSRDIFLGHKADLTIAYELGLANRDREWIVEELLDLSFPFALAGTDAQQQEKIDIADRERRPRELRVHVFGWAGEGELVTSAILRVADPEDRCVGRGGWAYVDPESVPEDVLSKTGEIVSAIEKATSVLEFHVAVDWVFARRQDDADPRWIPMEINGGEPVLLDEWDDPVLASEQAGKLADQLHRVAERGSTR